MAPSNSRNVRSTALETALKADRVRLQIARLNALGMNGQKIVANMEKEKK